MKVISLVSPDLWDRVVDRSEYATFFHTATWARILTGTFPEYAVATKGFMLDDGAIAIVPVVGTCERNRFFRWYESTLPGTYGGPVAERHLTRSEIDDIFCHLASPYTARIHIMGNPFARMGLPSSYNRIQLHTHVLDLSRGYDAIVKHYRSGHKYSLNKARRLGIEISVASTAKDYSDYYGIYQDSLSRWGDKTLASYPYDLFARINACQSEKIRLWVARADDEIVSGCLIFYHNTHVAYWHAATRSSYLSSGAGPLLITEIIHDACERGFSIFDFNPSGGLPGVETYKEGFGAEKRLFYSYAWEGNRLYRGYQAIRNSGKIILNKL